MVLGNRVSAAREWSALGVLAAVAVVAMGSLAQAQNGVFNNRAVGGVYIDGSGLVASASQADLTGARQAIESKAEPVAAELALKAGLRTVSLKALDLMLRQRADAGQPIPDAAFYLAGLQRIEYVLVYPERGDIVLAGPGEGWKVGDKGAMVGVTTGRPVMLLDDLAVALRAALAPQPAVISCSIDPNRDRLQRLRKFTDSLKTIGNPQNTAAGIEQVLGPQEVSVTGVPATSHFARVIVAADYRMKRISMGIEPAPVAGLPSFVSMMTAGGSGMQNMLPRWWLAPDYQGLVRDAGGLTWQLRGGTVKAMAENDFLDAAGVKHHTGKADSVSQRWAQNMTAKYDELSLAEPVFGELRNCMDMALAASLIAGERLLDKASLSLPMLAGPDGMKTFEFAAPKQVSSKAVLARQGRKWLIAAGGVQINAWELVSKPQTDASVADVRQKVGQPADGTFWAN